LEITLPEKHVFAPDGAHRIGVYFAEDCQGSVESFLRIKRLIEARYGGASIGICLENRSGSVAIPVDSNQRLVFFSSAESLRIPDWIEVVHADDFRFCPNLRGVIAGGSGKSTAFAAAESLSASSSLGQLKSSEEALSALARMKVAEALRRGGRVDRFS
jgi:hypothetical protein